MVVGMEESQRILKLAVAMGEVLLKSGGEIYRVQETVERILEAYGIDDYHVFVVSNGIFATIHEDREDRGSMVRNVPLGSLHLGRIAQVNQLSREICSHNCTVEEAGERLRACQQEDDIGWVKKILAGGMGSSAFSYLYGGRGAECVVAFFLGMLLLMFVQAAEKGNVSKFIVNIIGSAMVTVISFGLSAAGFLLMADKAVIRWHLQRGIILFPKSSHRERMQLNQQVFDFTLAEKDMEEIYKLDRRKRIGANPDNFNF